MPNDGGLRSIFRHEYKAWQWTSIETAFSASGVPDSEFCTPTGISGWIEYKKTHFFYVKFQPFQAPWLEKRCRYGGNAWIAVRRMHIKSGADELWLAKGDQALAMQEYGLEYVHATVWEGGPSRWNFDEIANQLCNP